MGRTARAGRSGKAITFVSQYDIELYQRIEQLIGKKLPLYETVDDEVMTFRDRWFFQLGRLVQSGAAGRGKGFVPCFF